MKASSQVTFKNSPQLTKKKTTNQEGHAFLMNQNGQTVTKGKPQERFKMLLKEDNETCNTPEQTLPDRE